MSIAGATVKSVFWNPGETPSIASFVLTTDKGTYLVKPGSLMPFNGTGENDFTEEVRPIVGSARICEVRKGKEGEVILLFDNEHALVFTLTFDGHVVGSNLYIDRPEEFREWRDEYERMTVLP